MILSRSKPIPIKFALFAMSTLAMSFLSTIWSVYFTSNNSITTVSVERKTSNASSVTSKARLCSRLASSSRDDEVTNSTNVSNVGNVAVNNNGSGVKFCTPQLKCPRPTDYHTTCKKLATQEGTQEKSFGQPPPLPSVRDPDNFLDVLQSFFHGKRVALIGDSLTRQWFETLSCRLGLHIHFYEMRKSMAPQRVTEAQEYKVKCDPLKAPKGNETIYPYMRAFPNHFLPLDPHDQLPPLAVNNNASTTRGCKEIQTTLEYFKFEIGRKSAGIIDLFAEVGDVDMIVINIGIHYGIARKYIHDLRYIMEKCARVNSKYSASTYVNNGTNSRIMKKLCLFRETFPRHWVPRDYRHDDTSFAKGEETPLSTPFDKKLLNQASCGPFLPGIYPVRYNPNSYVDDIAYAYDVGVVKVEHFAKSAWKWHFPGDCTHYCHDNEFWDLVHQSLVDTAIERW